MKPTDRGYMTVYEAAKMSGVSNAIVYTAIRTGKLEAQIIDGRYMVRPEAVKAWRDNTRDRSGALLTPLGQQGNVCRHCSDCPGTAYDDERMAAEGYSEAD